jgi:peroxiredoxin
MFKVGSFLRLTAKATALPLLLVFIGMHSTAAEDSSHREGHAVASDAQASKSEKATASASSDANDLQSLGDEINEKIAAWEAGKPTNFGAVADRFASAMRTKPRIELFQWAQQFGRILEIAGETDAAKKVYNAMQKSAGELKELDPESIHALKQMAGSGLKRINLIGTHPEIQGTLVSGDKFEWSKYKGKVVLLDFWATWCGPCRAELPNVKKAYEKYHSQGFDVIGISLDDDAEVLTEFLEREQLPWKTLFDSDPTKRGFEGVKLVQDFGIDGIPATFLIDQKGKIVSISARGRQLDEQLKKLLGQK